MKLLTDTHAFLWLMREERQLSQVARQSFLDTQNDLYFSLASFWEIGIKVSLGKLSFS